MKKILCIVFASTILLYACNTGGKATSTQRYKGKFEVKALCMNYTFTVTEGNIDTSLVNASWADESTGKIYNNAFGIKNPCDLPKDLQAGDEFYFVIDTAKGSPCQVCMAYYPTPPRKLSIKVVGK